KSRDPIINLHLHQHGFDMMSICIAGREPKGEQSPSGYPPLARAWLSTRPLVTRTMSAEATREMQLAYAVVQAYTELERRRRQLSEAETTFELRSAEYRSVSRVKERMVSGHLLSLDPPSVAQAVPIDVLARIFSLNPTP